jgi:hypothetical protein
MATGRHGQEYLATRLVRLRRLAWLANLTRSHSVLCCGALPICHRAYPRRRRPRTPAAEAYGTRRYAVSMMVSVECSREFTHFIYPARKAPNGQPGSAKDGAVPTHSVSMCAVRRSQRHTQRSSGVAGCLASEAVPRMRRESGQRVPAAQQEWLYFRTKMESEQQKLPHPPAF